MNNINLLRFLGVAYCLTFASCALWPYPNSHEAAKRDGDGYSLDTPASGSRYMAGSTNSTPAGTPSDAGVVTSSTAPEVSTTTGTVTTTTTTDTSVPPSTPAPTTGTSPGPSSTAVTPPAPQTTASPNYGTPVPGRRGFVYPPGVDAKPENMVDVRDFQPGQKVRDPRTGKIFLVP